MSKHMVLCGLLGLEDFDIVFEYPPKSGGLDESVQTHP